MSEEDNTHDPLNEMIKKTGCAELHEKVQLCAFEHQDWRKCQLEVKEFRNCMEIYKVRQQEERAKQNKQ